MKLRLIDLAGPAGMALFIIAVQIISLLLVAPLTENSLQAFENPESIWNPVFYIVLIIIFSAVLLLIIKFNMRWIIQAFMIFAVFSTMIYVLFAVGMLLIPGDITLPVQGISKEIAVAAAAVLLSIVLTALMIVYPEWYIVDAVGIMVAAGASAMFGISLSVIPTIILLVLLAVYDFIAVYKTKHMIKLAEGVMDLKLPILFVLPRKLSYSYVHSKTTKLEPGKEREAYFMGLGDAVMPTVLVVSASAFLPHVPAIGITNVPAIGTMIGTLISYVLLMYFVMKGKPQAGLPFLCTGAIIGFLLGCAAVGINPFF